MNGYFHDLYYSLSVDILIAYTLEEISLFIIFFRVWRWALLELKLCLVLENSMLSWVMLLFHVIWLDSIISGGTPTILCVSFHYFTYSIISIPHLFLIIFISAFTFYVISEFFSSLFSISVSCKFVSYGIQCIHCMSSPWVLVSLHMLLILVSSHQGHCLFNRGNSL